MQDYQSRWMGTGFNRFGCSISLNRSGSNVWTTGLLRTAPRYDRLMDNGILRPDDGFDVIVNGINRSFRDREKAAYEAARHLKERHPGELIEVRVRRRQHWTQHDKSLI
jgi:hypothetical protein